jgi:hypothetical protein
VPLLPERAKNKTGRPGPSDMFEFIHQPEYACRGL